MSKINFLSHNLSGVGVKLNQEETLILETSFKWDSAEALTKVWVELLYKGETVVKDICLSEEITPSPDAYYKANFKITPPFNAPDGIYYIRMGANEDREEDSIIISRVQIGKPKKEVEPYEAIITNAVFPSKIKKNVNFKVKADIKFSKAIDFNTSAYLTLLKDGLLYEVLEGKISLSNEDKTLEFKTSLNSDLPDGEYLAQIGVHNVNSGNTESKTVIVSGSDTVRSKYHKPMSYGNYFVKSSGKEHFWYVNQFGAMIWDGEPYIPFGGMFVPKYLRQYDFNNPEVNKAHFEQDKADLEELKAAGICDLYIGANIIDVTPIWVFEYFIDYLEKNDWKYGIQGDTAKKPKGSVYYPRATDKSGQFKINNIRKSEEVSLVINTSFVGNFDSQKSAVYVVLDDITGELADSGKIKIIKNENHEIVLTANVKVNSENSHTIYFSPEFYQSLGDAVNYWDEPEITHDRTNIVYSRMKSGDNLRFLIDIHNNECGIYNSIETGRFSDEQFNVLFAKWLQDKYKTISKLNKAWKTEPELLTFEEASVLIPVYTSKKDENNNSYSYFVNINSGVAYLIDTNKGSSWNDYLDARDDLYLDFMNMAANIAKKYLDVPVIYKHVSVHRRYFINKNKIGGFDGMGSEAYGCVDKVSNQFVCTSALNNQFAKTAWNLITETNNLENVMGKYESGQWSYVSKEDMHTRFNAALDLGMKGIFDFLLADRPDIGGKLGMAYSWIINKHVIEWAKEYKKVLHNPEFVNELVGRKYKNEVFYYYPPNKNWWMKPNERSCVQLEDDSYSFKRLKTEKGIHILPTEDLSVDARLIFINLNDGPYSKVYGPQLSEFLSENYKDKAICILGHRNDIGTIPEIDKYYTTEKVSINNGTEVVQVLKPTENCEILRTTFDGKPWALKDGNIYIVATDSFETSVGDFGTLHYVDDLGVTNFD